MSQSPPGVDMSEWMNEPRRLRIPRARSSSRSPPASNQRSGAQASEGAAQPTITLASEDELGPEDELAHGDNSAPEEDFTPEESPAYESAFACEDDSASDGHIPSGGDGRGRNAASVSRRSSGDETYAPSRPGSSGNSRHSSPSDTRDTDLDHEIAQSSSAASSTSAERQDSDTPACLNQLPIDKAFEIFAANSYDQVAGHFNLEADSISTYVSKTVRSISQRDNRPRWEVKDDLNHRRKRNGIIEKIDDLIGIREYKKRGKQSRRHGPRTNRDDVEEAACESLEGEDDQLEASPELEASSEQSEPLPPEAQQIPVGSSHESPRADTEPGETSATTSPRGLDDQDQSTASPTEEPNALVERMRSMAGGRTGVRSEIVVGGTVFWHENLPVTVVHEK